MKRFLLALGLVSTLGLAATPAAARTPFSVEGGVAFHSTYAWRGYEVASAASVQPNLTFSFDEQGLWLDVWGAYAAQDRSQWRDADEVDITLGYDREFEFGLHDAWMSVGYVYYALPRLEGTNNATQEVFASFGVGTFLQPSLNVFYDFDLGEAWYLSPALAHSLWLGPGFGPSIDLTASLGFTDSLVDEVGDTGFGWQDLTLGASMDFGLGSMTFTPQVGYAFADASINPDESVFWGGARLGFGF